MKTESSFCYLFKSSAVTLAFFLYHVRPPRVQRRSRFVFRFAFASLHSVWNASDITRRRIICATESKRARRRRRIIYSRVIISLGPRNVQYKTATADDDITSEHNPRPVCTYLERLDRRSIKTRLVFSRTFSSRPRKAPSVRDEITIRHGEKPSPVSRR